jgi:hypothetical protein
MTFTGNPNLHFDLTALGPGPVNTVCSNAFDPNAASCSVAPGSPFKLTPTATGTDVTLAATGIARDSSAQTSQWMGNFSTTFPGITPAQVQDAILNGTTVGLFCSNHACSSTYSGTFTVSILPAGNGCTLTQGGYKNHFNSLVLNFPGIPNGSHGLTIGTVFYTNAQLNAILQNNAIRGNGLLALAHQLITAELNLAYGGVPSDPAQVAALNNAITAANALIGGLVIPPIGNGELSPSLTGTLTNFFDDYNNGNFGVPHCN